VITFLIVGHDEEDTVSPVIRMTMDAAGPGDRVLFVDSASTDNTVKAAFDTGVEVLLGPIGKGAAMAVGIEAADTAWICFLDADMVQSTTNIAQRLRAAVHVTSADHVVGEFVDPFRNVLSNTVGVYEPLVRGLFPEIAGRLGSKPLTGFRGVRRRLIPDRLPPDFGVEAALNIEVAMAGGVSVVVPIGEFGGKFKPHPNMGREICRAILDRAEGYGRLSAAARPQWEQWVAGVLSVISVTKVRSRDRAGYVERLKAAAARPLPRAA
jgi:glucosyl-3-phosphoglycerate synthase